MLVLKGKQLARFQGQEGIGVGVWIGRYNINQQTANYKDEEKKKWRETWGSTHEALDKHTHINIINT